RLPYYFPAIRDLKAVFHVFDADIHAAELFHATRLAGAPDPTPASRQAEEGDARTGADEPPAPAQPGATANEMLTRRAQQAEKHGNLVRAMLLLERAAPAGAGGAKIVDQL